MEHAREGDAPLHNLHPGRSVHDPGTRDQGLKHTEFHQPTAQYARGNSISTHDFDSAHFAHDELHPAHEHVMEGNEQGMLGSDGYIDNETVQENGGNGAGVCQGVWL